MVADRARFEARSIGERIPRFQRKLPRDPPTRPIHPRPDTMNLDEIRAASGLADAPLEALFDHYTSRDSRITTAELLETFGSAGA